MYQSKCFNSNRDGTVGDVIVFKKSDKKYVGSYHKEYV